MKLPNFKPVTRFGLSQGADRKAGIAAAALPKMRMPSGLAQETKKMPKIAALKKKAAEVMATREHLDGDLEGGKPLAVAVGAMARSDVSTDAAEVAKDQAAFRELHGSSDGWEAGRP